MISWLAGEAVPILGKYHRYPTGSYEIPNSVHSRSLQACSALPPVEDLIEDPVSLSGGVLPEGFHLLG